MHTDVQTQEPLADIKPRGVIHFSSGETLTDDDSEEEEQQHLHQTPSVSDPGNWTWKDYSRFWGTHIFRKSLRFCDFLGEKMAGLLGLNAAKYQYAVDQYDRAHKNETEGEILSARRSVNEEKIKLSKIAIKNYGATKKPEPTDKQTPRETPLYEGEENEAYKSVEE